MPVFPVSVGKMSRPHNLSVFQVSVGKMSYLSVFQHASVSSVCGGDVPPSQPVRVSGVCVEDLPPVRVSGVCGEDFLPVRVSGVCR